MALAVSLALLALSLLMASTLPGLHFDTLLAPMVILVPLITLLCFQVGKDVYILVKQKKSAASQEVIADSVAKQSFSLKKFFSLDAPYKIFIWMVIFVGICYLISIPLGGLLFIFLYLKVVEKERWLVSILVAVGTAGFLYIIFGVFIGVNFLGTSFVFSRLGW